MVGARVCQSRRLGGRLRRCSGDRPPQDRESQAVPECAIGEPVPDQIVRKVLRGDAAKACHPAPEASPVFDDVVHMRQWRALRHCARASVLEAGTQSPRQNGARTETSVLRSQDGTRCESIFQSSLQLCGASGRPGRQSCDDVAETVAGGHHVHEGALSGRPALPSRSCPWCALLTLPLFGVGKGKPVNFGPAGQPLAILLGNGAQHRVPPSECGARVDLEPCSCPTDAEPLGHAAPI